MVWRNVLPHVHMYGALPGCGSPHRVSEAEKQKLDQNQKRRRRRRLGVWFLMGHFDFNQIICAHKFMPCHIVSGGCFLL